MAYNELPIDSKLRNWFSHDINHALLRSIRLRVGNIRGLKPFQVSFDYPIAVIAGRNGSGKTSMLALAACAFHAGEDGYKLPGRRFSYYTLSDFLIQSKEEVPPEGVSISYGIAHNNWKVTKEQPLKEGVLYQTLSRTKGGKWRTYRNRVSRPVIFIGIDRVVPHSEKSVSRSYRSAFKKSISGCEDNVLQSVGRVLGNKYDDFHFKSYSKYRLPVVSRNGLTYSGFNMGAGENALFEIFFNLHTCPEGTLVIVDEIELGLHHEAQKRLVRELKEICLARKIQIICTTHSGAVIAQVPPDGRFFVESNLTSTSILPGVTPDYAIGMMAGSNSEELIIYVEDKVAADLLISTFDKKTRSRVSVIPIGSDAAVISLMAGLRREGRREKILAVLDGDKGSNLKSKCTLFFKKLESAINKEVEIAWIEQRLLALPGEHWPEYWIMQRLKDCITGSLLDQLGVSDKDDMLHMISKAENAGKHSEFVALAEELYTDPLHLRRTISSHVATQCRGDFSNITERVTEILAS